MTEIGFNIMLIKFKKGDRVIVTMTDTAYSPRAKEGMTGTIKHADFYHDFNADDSRGITYAINFDVPVVEYDYYGDYFVRELYLDFEKPTEGDDWI